MWTLKIEFIGSLLLIIYLIISFRKKQKYTLTLFFIFLTLIFKNESIYYYLFAAGAFIKRIPNLKGFSLYFLIILGLYLISFQDSYFYRFLNEIPFSNLRIPIHGAGSLILIYCIRNGFMKKLLTSKACLFFGGISYSVYLIHHLILCSFTSEIYIASYQYNFSLYLIYAFYIFSTICFSYFVFNKIDNYGIKFSNIITKKIYNFLKF